jgi:hypothetical protein
MMTRQRATLLLGLFLFIVPSAHAEPFPIHITHGALEGDRASATLTVRQQGLAIDADMGYTGGVWGLSFCPCSPGVLLPFDAFWSDSDLVGLVTFRGRTFLTGLGTTGNEGGLAVEFRASTALPAFTGQRLISLRTPFLFRGRLSMPSYPADLFFNYELWGAGRTTLQFRWSPLESAWLARSARYDFVATPEPSTLAMTGMVVGALSLVRLFRRRVDA